MRFVLDEDVSVALIAVLQAHGHEAWSINDTGLDGIPDDDVTVYAASKGAVVVTHDREFSNRRRANPHGRHVQLGCKEREAADLVGERVAELVKAMQPHPDVFAYMSKEGVSIHLKWA
ncbi:DUF5615 family PIN-like protein [Pimelobacter simplex]|uniref:DUF5615 family PIN-like protein n=1 Tax=Nocardioides simplex TaxID=2045 RepID=UPI00366B12E6